MGPRASLCKGLFRICAPARQRAREERERVAVRPPPGPRLAVEPGSSSLLLLRFSRTTSTASSHAMLRSTLARCPPSTTTARPHRAPLPPLAAFSARSSLSSLARRPATQPAHPHAFPVIASLVDTASTTFEERAGQMKEREDELRAMWGKVALGGGERARTKAKKAGKLLVRERCVLISSRALSAQR